MPIVTIFVADEMDLELGVAGDNQVARLERNVINRLAVDRGAVAAGQIVQPAMLLVAIEPEVGSRHARVHHSKIGISRTAGNELLSAGDRNRSSLAGAVDDGEHDCSHLRFLGVLASPTG